MQAYSNNALSAEIIDWPVHMRRALQLAANIITATPNPRVGCVIIKHGEVVGEGWHSATGQPHAEVVALTNAGTAARGATVFVTLEPCAHTGRTGPCAEALVQAGVRQVVIPCIDPNPDVAGNGVAILEAAGIEVFHLIDFEQDARNLNRGYFKRRLQGLPFVRCKLAMSLDGRTALHNGESQWITGAAARADVQLLRARSSAVLTGIGTVLADDPSMNVRRAELPLTDAELEANALALAQQPLRVILDTQLRTPAAARILQEDGRVVIYTHETTSGQLVLADNVELQAVAATGPQVALNIVLESLASEFECNEILVEAGATLSTAFVEAGLVDELIVYIAPKLLGSDGRALLEVTGLTSLAESINFSIVDLTLIGGDIRVTLVPQTADGA